VDMKVGTNTVNGR